MEGIQLILDPAGHLQEIRIDVAQDPELAEEIYKLVQAVKRSRDAKQADERPKAPVAARARLSQRAFNQLLSQSRASGDLSQPEFFQSYPQWRKKEKLFLRN